MKYLVLKKLAVDYVPFIEQCSASSKKEMFEFPYAVETYELNEDDAADWARNPQVVDLIPSIPYTLVEPVKIEGESNANSDSAWGISAVGADTSPRDGSGVTVAVLDTGIDRDHAAFQHITFADDDLMDFTENEEGVPGQAKDDQGHGTHCAGTIFGGEVNGIRIGVAPNVSRVLIGKVLGQNGAPTESLFNAMEWALRRRADVISMSLGIDFPGLVERLVQFYDLPKDIAASRALEAYRSNVRLFDRLAALIEARAHRGRGALIVAASGNESHRDVNPNYTVAVAPPAAADGFISVGAVGQTENNSTPFSVAFFSNTGCRICAPGVGIISAKPGGGLTEMSGTSMATPHVAGVVALWTQSIFPGGDRPARWVEDVELNFLNAARMLPGFTRKDNGLGLIKAP